MEEKFLVLAKYLERRVGSPGDPTHNCLLEAAFWIRMTTLIDFHAFGIRVISLIDFDALFLASLQHVTACNPAH